MKNLFDLRGERILVTGAGGSIGGATARVCAALGAELFIADLKAPTELGSELKARAAALDNTRRDDVEALVKDIGHLDALIDASGYYVKGDWLEGGDEWDELFARTMAINVRGPMNLVRAVLPQMRARRSGCIVSVSSIAGKEGTPRLIPYSVAKAGIIAFTKALGKEVVADGIRVNCVAPGVIDTPLLGQLPETATQIMLSKAPMGRFGTADEVAAVVQFLASDDASFVTSQCFDASGGRATY